MSYNILLKQAGLLDFLKEKPAEVPPPWDPNVIDFNGTPYAFDMTGVHNTLKKDLKAHYSKLLAAAYLASTGKTLKNPEKHIHPRYGVMLGRAANVDPDILKKLDQDAQDRLGGWSSTAYNVDPGLVMDAVDQVNNVPYLPYDAQGKLKPVYRQSDPIKVVPA